MPNVAVSDIIDRARSQADMQSSNFVTETEWLRWLNVEYKALALLLARSGYVLLEGRDDITATGASDYALTDWLVVLGVYHLESGRYRRLKHSDLMDGPGHISTTDVGNASHFRIWQATNALRIAFHPIPSSGTYQVYGIQEPATLTISSNISIPGGLEEWLVLRLARRALAKEESPTTFVDRLLAEVERQVEEFCWDRVMGGHQQVRNVDKAERGWDKYPHIPSRESWLWV